MENRDVQSVLDFLGIDPEEYLSTRDEVKDEATHRSQEPFSPYQQKARAMQYRRVINRLMNITLQCLGSIRLLVNELEKIRVSLDTTDIDGTHRDSGTTHYLQRQLFVQAIKTIGDTILVGKDLDYHDPMKDLIDSFPWEYSLTRHTESHWLLLDWALMSPFLSRLYSPSEDSTQSPLILQLEKDKSLHYTSLIKNILKYYPVSITEIDKFGQHYLSYLIRSADIILANTNTPITTNHSLLEDVIQYHKNCCKLYDGKGKLAIHYAAHYSQSVETLLIISEGMKKPLTDIMYNTVDDLGNLPLHHACYGNCSLAVFREILFNYPDAVKIPNNQDALPIHILSQYAYAPLTSANALPTINPSHSRTGGPVSQVPPSSTSSLITDNLEKFRLLISSYPQGLETLDGNGLIPLQIAAFYSKSLDYIKFLYEQYRMAISRPCNDTGRLPLHYNTVYCYSSKIMKYLIDLFPDSVKVMDYNQRLPLHTLIARTEYMTPGRMRCLRLLLEEYPFGAAMRDKDGQTPLDLARRNELGDLVERLLLRADPGQDPIALGELTYIASQAKFGGDGGEKKEDFHRHNNNRGHNQRRPPKPRQSRHAKDRRRDGDARGDKDRSRRRKGKITARSGRRYSRDSRASTSRTADSEAISYYDDKDAESNTYYDSYDSEDDDDVEYYHDDDGKRSEPMSVRRGDESGRTGDASGRRGGDDSARDSRTGTFYSEGVSESYFDDEYSLSRRDNASEASYDR